MQEKLGNHLIIQNSYFSNFSGLKFERPIRFKTVKDIRNIKPIKTREIKVNYPPFKGVSLQKAQIFKDKFLVPDLCYKAIQKYINPNIPSVKRLRSHRQFLNKNYMLKKNNFGYFNDVKTKVTSILQNGNRTLFLPKSLPLLIIEQPLVKTPNLKSTCILI